MAYTREQWMKRIALRTDLTSGLIHLTRATDDDDVITVLLNILTSKILIGSTTNTGFIVGVNPAVCFQEAPIYSVLQNIYSEASNTSRGKKYSRYSGYGIQISKDTVYNAGGRPVIYDATVKAKSYLPENEWWRIVNFDLSNPNQIIDWSHEREWRVPGDFSFTLSDIAILVPNSESYKELVSRCTSQAPEILSDIRGIVHVGAVFY